MPLADQAGREVCVICNHAAVRLGVDKCEDHSGGFRVNVIICGLPTEVPPEAAVEHGKIVGLNEGDSEEQ